MDFNIFMDEIEGFMGFNCCKVLGSNFNEWEGK